MSVLQRFRQWPRWLVIALCFVALSVTALEYVPHDEVEGRNCLVCKASQQPLEQHAAVLGPEQPCGRASSAPTFQTTLTSIPISDSGSPRAPPA